MQYALCYICVYTYIHTYIHINKYIIIDIVNVSRGLLIHQSKSLLNRWEKRTHEEEPDQNWKESDLTTSKIAIYNSR